MATSVPLIETTNGKFSGLSSAGAHVFKGIPYALPPTGAGRFAAPRPPEKWVGIREAVTFGNSAMQEPRQIGLPFLWYWSQMPFSEDCLTLNVFTPEHRDTGKMPVMVWFHGGGMATGSGSAPGFDGSTLAAVGKVVVVSVNHRLNIFGFFHPGKAGGERFIDASNAGMLDLVSALEWVRDNIEAFGGDAGNVTIFGQSGGGAKVGRLMAMPAAKGLFHRAILQSSALRAVALEDAEKAAHYVLRYLDISPEQLHDVPAEALQRARAATIKEFGVDYFQPVADDRTLFEAPFHHHAPKVSAGIPLMIGSVAQESMYRLYNQPDIETLTRQEALERLERLSGIPIAEGGDLFDLYASLRPGARPLDVYSDILTDQRYRLNILRTAELKAKQAGAPAWLYRFQWQSPLYDGLLKSPHTIEIPFVFGTLEAARHMLGDGPELAGIRDATMGAWLAFARHGNPNHDKLPEWQPYSAEERGTMLLDEVSRFIADPPRPDIEMLARFRIDKAHSTDM